MAVPSKDDFDLAIDGFKQIKSMAYTGHVSEEMFLPADSGKTAIHSILGCLSAQTAKWDELKKVNAVRWLTNDRFMQRAYVASKKPINGWLTQSAVAEEIYLRTARDVREHSGYNGPRRGLGYGMFDFRDDILNCVWRYRPYGMKWTLALLPAYCEYFHQPNAVDEFIDQEKRIDALAKQAISGQNALLELAKIASHRGSKFVDEERARVRIDQLTRFVERARHEAKNGAVPIARRDRTARERLLLWRLWNALKGTTGVVRPAAIKNLLRVEGVENEMDDKSVDVAIKKYNEQRAARDKHLQELHKEWALGRREA